MIKYVLKENKNKKSLAFGKWYAFPVADETIDLSDLAKHMEEHNTGFSEAMCLGMMTAMVKCIKEQLLAGKNVKIDNLAIFSVGIRNKEGAKTEAEFTVAGNISGLKLRARATGTLSNANLYNQANVRKVSATVSSTSTGDNKPSGGGSTPSTGGSTPSGGDSTGGTNPPGGEGTDGEESAALSIFSPQTLYQSPRVWGIFLLPDKHRICPLRHLY